MSLDSMHIGISGLTTDAVVIGGGFYGCETALELKRLGFGRVIVAEREPGLLRRASFVNQARVHNGYHYPRAFATALKSRENFERFVSDYSYAVMHDLEKYYAIARGSRVSADQFENFCQNIGAFCRPARREISQLFEAGTMERVFHVRELAFDTRKLAAALQERMKRAGVELHTGTEARVLSSDDGGVHLDIGGRHERAAYVFNCTYAELEGVGVTIKTRIKKELTEMVLIAPPPQVQGRGFTVMDGPFFSTMPFPTAGLHTLSHVRYTPHEASEDPSGAAIRPIKSNSIAMIRDAARFMPCLEHARVIESIYEIKAVLLRNEDDDARPILVETCDDSRRILSILGAKIDNVYELKQYLRGQIWH